MKTPHYDIAIATPGRTMEAEYVQSLMKTVAHLQQKNMSWTYLNRYSSFVPSAREKTATNSAEQNWDAIEIADGAFTYDWLIWIDSDIVWEPEVIERLTSHNYDVVSALVPSDSAGGLTAMKLDENLSPQQLTWKTTMLEAEPIQVDGVGFGMVAVKYGVFERTPRPWFLIRRARINGVPFSVNYGEDYSVCVNIKDAGFLIWLDPLAKVQHIKSIMLSI